MELLAPLEFRAGRNYFLYYCAVKSGNLLLTFSGNRCVQLVVLGIAGEYLGRMFDETKRRPLYFVNSYHDQRGCQIAQDHTATAPSFLAEGQVAQPSPTKQGKCQQSNDRPSQGMQTGTPIIRHRGDPRVEEEE